MRGISIRSISTDPAPDGSIDVMVTLDAIGQTPGEAILAIVSALEGIEWEPRRYDRA